MEWSPLQQAIFSHCRTMETSLVVLARAGTGKTTTIVEAAKSLPRGKVLFAAFNKSIASELAKRLPAGVDAKTLHSVGFSLTRSAFPRIRMDESRTKNLIAETLISQKMVDSSGRPDADIASRLSKLISLAKSTLAASKQDLIDTAIAFDLANGEPSPETLAKLGGKILSACEADTGSLDFDDMCWLPWAHQIARPLYDYVIVDEAQDMSPCQLWLAQSVLRENGKMVIVGDPAQAIYAWRGADSGALERMARELSAKTLPLSITYRCPKKVVSLAQAVVPDYAAHDSAPEGIVRESSLGAIDPQAGDFILSRKNAPLASLCLSLLAKGLPAVIQGRDIASTLLSLVKKSKAKTLPELTEFLENYRNKETERLSKLGEKGEKRIQEAHDRVDCLVALSEGLDSVAALNARIEGLFSDGAPESKIVLSSTHKAKGLERNRVFVLRETYRAESGTGEEANLWYVAITRAKRELILVSN